MRALKTGDVIKLKKLVLGSRYVREGEHWAVIIDDEASIYPDGMIYTRADGKWSSQVASIGGGDEYVLASEDDVPEDIPDDFWPLAARYKLVGDQA